MIYLLFIPLILERTSAGRPETLDKVTIVIGGISTSSIINSIYSARTLHTNSLLSPPDYMDTHVSIKFAKIIQSYIPIINEFIWHKL